MMPRDAEEYENGGNDPVEDIVTEPEVEETESPDKQKAEEYLANWQRAQADFVNYKRRMEQERQEFNKFANANLILALLPAIDDLERGLEAIPAKHAHSKWVEGIRMVERKLKTSLEGQGVKQITALGEPFDPNFHEALRQDKGPEGIVIEEFQKGYMLHDKLLRPARVVVGNGEEESKEEA